MEGFIKRVLVVGAAGYIGAKLSYELSSKGYSVTALCHSKPKNTTSWTNSLEKIIVGDIRDSKTLNKIKNKNFYAIINLVSLNHFQSEEDLNDVFSINIMPTWLILNEFTKLGLVKYINMSTIHVYGNLLSKKISEKSTPNPLNNYSLSHYLSEKICTYFNNSSNINCYNLRLSNGFGSPFFPDNNCWWLVLNDFCKNIYFNNKIDIKSDGTPLRDFIHLNDVIGVIDFFLNKDDANYNNVFNIASGKTYSISELAYIVKKIYDKRYNKNSKINFLNGFKKNNQQKFKISIDKLKKAGYNVSTTIDNGVNELFDYFDKKETVR